MTIFVMATPVGGVPDDRMAWKPTLWKDPSLRHPASQVSD
jgi:hypothetical protein